MNNLTDTYLLSNGTAIPVLGYGTFRTPAGDVCVNGVRTALEAGYRHVDTAATYGNEESVGLGIARSDIPRQEIFLTTKLWNTDQGRDRTLFAFDLSLKKLQTDYVDLYLVHWPIALDFKSTYPKQMLESWHVIEELYREGRAKAIGVSNFFVPHLKTLLSEADIQPMADQVEYHVGLAQRDTQETLDFCRAHNMLIEAWSPICKARCLDNPLLREISAKYGKTPAQILIRWCLQKEVVPLPKSVTPSRIYENKDVFDFSLSPSDMSLLDAVDSVGRLGSHPDSAKF